LQKSSRQWLKWLGWKEEGQKEGQKEEEEGVVEEGEGNEEDKQMVVGRLANSPHPIRASQISA
jgi:hypothetical protein